jgi:hypothetical protein
VDLYIHSPIRLLSIVLNYVSKGTILSYLVLLTMWLLTIFSSSLFKFTWNSTYFHRSSSVTTRSLPLGQNLTPRFISSRLQSYTLPTERTINTPPEIMATAVFSETFEIFQHYMQCVPESRSHLLSCHRKLRTRTVKLFKSIVEGVFWRFRAYNEIPFWLRWLFQVPCCRLQFGYCTHCYRL